MSHDRETPMCACGHAKHEGRCSERIWRGLFTQVCGCMGDRAEPAERLRAFVRRAMPGRCKALSVGAACTCPLCDIDRLRAVRPVEGEDAAHTAFLAGADWAWTHAADWGYSALSDGAEQAFTRYLAARAPLSARPTPNGD